MREATMPAVIKRFQRLKIQDWYASGTTRSAPKTKSSSRTKGSAKARANGQPTTAPMAKAKVASHVLRALRMLGSSRACENANMDMYIAKDEGRNAEER